MSARAWPTLLCLWLSACAPAEPGLWVKLEDLPEDTEFLVVRGLLDSAHVLDFERPRPDSFTSFALTLPRMVFGRDFAVAVEAYKQGLRCVHASATSDSVLLQEDRHLVLKLKMNAQPCELRVAALGEGSGEISVSNDQERTIRQPRTLTAKPAPDSYFAGWRGSCGPTLEEADASGVCQVDDLAPVAALFGLRGCTAAPGLANWCWENPLPQGNDVSGVHGLAHNDVWAVGAAGTLLHFDGNAWSVIRPSGIPLADLLKQDLRAIWGVGRELFVVGTEGLILHSEDRGVSWRLEVNSDKSDLWAIHGTSTDDVWAVGDAGAVLQRVDGVWTPRAQGGVRGKALRGVFVTPERVWLSGEGCTVGQVDRKSGDRWTAASCPFADTNVSLRGVRETSQGVFAVGARSGGAGVLLRWADQQLVAEAPPMEVDSRSWNALAELPGEGVLVAGEGGILRRAGGRWQAEGKRPAATLLSVWVSEVGGAFAAGEGGALHKRRQGSWPLQTVQAAKPSMGLRAFAHSQGTPHLIGGAPWVVGGERERALVLERSAELGRWRERPLRLGQGTLVQDLFGAAAKGAGTIALVGEKGLSVEVSAAGDARAVVVAAEPAPNWRAVWSNDVITCKVGERFAGEYQPAAECTPPVASAGLLAPHRLNSIVGSGGVVIAGGTGTGSLGSLYQVVNGAWQAAPANPPGNVYALWLNGGNELWTAGFDDQYRARVSRKRPPDAMFSLLWGDDEIKVDIGPLWTSSMHGLFGLTGPEQSAEVYAVGWLQHKAAAARGLALVVRFRSPSAGPASRTVELCGSQRLLHAVWGEAGGWLAIGEGQAVLRRHQ